VTAGDTPEVGSRRAHLPGAPPETMDTSLVRRHTLADLAVLAAAGLWPEHVAHGR